MKEDELHVIRIDDKIITITRNPQGDDSGIIDVSIHPADPDGYYVALRLDDEWRSVSFVSQDVRTFLESRIVDDL